MSTLASTIRTSAWRWRIKRHFLPHLLALSCSSPFWQGRDTGLASHRAELANAYPGRACPAVSLVAGIKDFIDTLVEQECIDSGRRLWWDLRCSVTYPTIEFRICDLPMTVNETIWISPDPVAGRAPDRAAP